jgi:hypothetical protein
MRSQLFSLTSAVDKERREKESALAKVLELEAFLHTEAGFASEAPAPPTPLLPPSTSIRNTSPASTPQATSGVRLPIPLALVTPATPVHEEIPSPPTETYPGPPPNVSQSADQNRKFRTWGFPKSPIKSSAAEKAAKRESFFGLSRSSPSAKIVEDQTLPDRGFDLPPLVIEKPATGQVPKSDSQLFDLSSKRLTRSDSAGFSSPSSSMSVSATAINILHGILSRSPTKQSEKPFGPFGRFLGQGNVTDFSLLPCQLDESGMDLRNGCPCCVGEVIEL